MLDDARLFPPSRYFSLCVFPMSAEGGQNGDAPRETASGLVVVDGVLEDLLRSLQARKAVVQILECEMLLERVRAVKALPSGSKERVDTLKEAMAFQRAVRRWMVKA